jgi:hypothetical protein
MRINISLLALSLMFATSCKKEVKKISLNVPDTDANAPSSSWKEHWFEHKQTVKLVKYNAEVALYYDDDMDRNILWPLRKSEEVWKYTKRVYAPFKGKDTRLNVVLHYGKYGGGHPFTYFDDGHDNRTGIDIGSNNSWADTSGWNLDVITHEIGHLVEGGFNGVKESPAFDIWGDSKWMEIYIYDVYKGLGWENERLRAYNSCMGTVDNFPRPGTQWFKNWFYPIYSLHGETATLDRFFKLLAEHFPKRTNAYGMEYTRRMNMGEFVHFWSGAAKTDLKDLALAAFGPNDWNGAAWAPQLDAAKTTFAKITY